MTFLCFQGLVVELRERLRAVLRELDGADPRTHVHKMATYHAWIASPQPCTARGPSHLLPRYLQLELSRHVLCNIARFHLRAHALGVETGYWQTHDRHWDKSDLHGVQDEKCVLFYALAWACANRDGSLQRILLILLRLISIPSPSCGQC